MADWRSGLDDPDSTEGLPPMASPLMAAGIDPDQARLQMLQPQTPAPLPPAVPATPGIDQQALDQEFKAGQQQIATANQAGQVDPQIAAMQQKKIADEQALASVDPSQYKPSFGNKVLRGIRAAALGAAVGGIPGLAVGAIDPAVFNNGKGYSAPTDAYDSALKSKQDQVNQDTEQSTNLADNFKRAAEARKAQAEGLNQGSETMGKVVTGQTGITNAATDKAKVPILQQQANTAAQVANQNSPSGKAALSQAEMLQRSRDADQRGLKGEQRTLYIFNGKIPDPRQPTEEEIALSRATQIFTKENGHPPSTLDEYQKVQAAARGNSGGGKGKSIDQGAVGPIVADFTAQKEKVANEYTRQPDGTYQKGDAPPITPEAFNNLMEGYRAKANVKLEKYGAQMNQSGDIVQTGTDQGAGSDDAKVTIQLPGHPPAEFSAADAQKFLKAHPTAKALQ